MFFTKSNAFRGFTNLLSIRGIADDILAGFLFFIFLSIDMKGSWTAVKVVSISAALEKRLQKSAYLR
jgi:hypothetical protein